MNKCLHLLTAFSQQVQRRDQIAARHTESMDQASIILDQVCICGAPVRWHFECPGEKFLGHYIGCAAAIRLRDQYNAGSR